MGNLEQKGKPLALAVETSGRTGSAALGAAGTILECEFLSGHLRHGAELFTCCRSLLQRNGFTPADIDHIYISAGPGSFTGIRIAVTMAKILHLATAARIVAVSSLDVLAENAADCAAKTACRIPHLATILDAKRGQFYIAVFDRHDDRWIKTVSDCLMTADDFLNRFARGPETLWLTGEGLIYYKDRFAAPNIAFVDEEYWFPHAANVYKLAWQQAKAGSFADPLTLTPTYLRGPEAIPKTF
ncbi:MAG TPA: tRNA (adenosine(37)-N6)-threonylcarbamoyltransferase complex dimerization subunit type 1 TsaB [Anaerohalosphaeraceae bacterium]|nr:tRNA (adenosine(37)-N6)-threonylcarbamoyltransferase complex dimerization subunit type 1 TsaB [Anaerohalosphaeraceae bacterium]